MTIVLLSGMIGCKKETTATVFVYEKGTDNPMVGIPVNFGYTSSNGLFAGGVVEQTKITDANGRVNFKGQDNNRSYSVGFPNGAYYFAEGVSLEEGDNNRVFLQAGTFAYVRVHAINVNPYNNNDCIDILNGYLGGGGGYLCGVNIDTIVIKGPFKGTGNGNFSWRVNKNNINSTFSTQLYFIGRDTINYSIEY